MAQLDSVTTLIVSQKKEWGEILSQFEFKNKYRVLDPSGAEVFLAFEKPKNILLRIFLKALRPFEMEILTPPQMPALFLKRPFRFFFHEIEVRDAAGVIQGKVVKEFSLLRRIYSVVDQTGNEVYQLFGPILHPWTFQIMSQGQEVGKITKKWSGGMKEVFTDADNFAIEFPRTATATQKAVLLGAVFLIDFVHFENRS